MATHFDRVTFFCCVSCKENTNMEEYAVYYCEKCQHCFCRKCCEQHDNLFNKHIKYDRRDMKNWPVSKELEAFLIMCETHTRKQLGSFCKDHCQLCCSECVSLSHRKCKQLKLYSAENQAADVDKLTVKLLINMRKLKKLQSCCESGIHDLKSSYQGQKLIVEKMNNRIKSTMDKIVRRTLKKISKVEQKEIHELMNSSLYDIEQNTLDQTKMTLLSLQDSLETGVKICIRHHRELKSLHEFLRYSSDNSKTKLCFIARQKCVYKLQHVEAYLQENMLKLECAVLNHTIQDTEQYIMKLSGLGRLVESIKYNTEIELYMSKLSGFASIEYIMNVCTVQGRSVHNVHISSDSYRCCIRSICVLPDGQVLVTDISNKKVKLLNRKYQVVSYCDVTYTPLEICQITPCEVAVTVDDNDTHGVQFIIVTQSQLVPGGKFHVQHECEGIAYHLEGLFISSGTALYKYSLRGILVSTIYEDASGSYTVVKCAVSPSGDKLYITDSYHSKLLTLARDGTVLATFKELELRGLRGVHVTPAGQVLVCGEWSGTILQVDSEGRKKLATLATGRDGVWCPESVCYSNNTSTIIVGQWDNNNILVFRVKNSCLPCVSRAHNNLTLEHFTVDVVETTAVSRARQFRSWTVVGPRRQHLYRVRQRNSRDLPTTTITKEWSVLDNGRQAEQQATEVATELGHQ